jgi:hypothetical protein
MGGLGKQYAVVIRRLTCELSSVLIAVMLVGNPHLIVFARHSVSADDDFEYLDDDDPHSWWCGTSSGNGHGNGINCQQTYDTHEKPTGCCVNACCYGSSMHCCNNVTGQCEDCGDNSGSGSSGNLMGFSLNEATLVAIIIGSCIGACLLLCCIRWRVKVVAQRQQRRQQGQQMQRLQHQQQRSQRSQYLYEATPSAPPIDPHFFTEIDAATTYSSTGTYNHHPQYQHNQRPSAPPIYVGAHVDSPQVMVNAYYLNDTPTKAASRQPVAVAVAL